MNLRMTMVILAVLFSPLLASSIPDTSAAQGAGEWQPPTQLAAAVTTDPENPAIVISPVIVADDWGNAHAFWQASISDNDGTLESSIFYSRWEPGGWSEPVDIFFAPRRILWAPQAAVDSRGRLHLIWENGSGRDIMYASASVAAADDALNWSLPETVTDSRVAAGGEMTKSFVATPDGELHLAYCTGGERATIEYMHLMDQWSTPTVIQTGISDYCRLNLAIDEQGRLHLVYIFTSGEGPTIFYTQSDDQGATWSNPLEIAAWQPDFYPGYGPNFPGILTHGDDVYISWLGYPRTQRWYQASSDRGETWNAAIELTPNLLLASDAPAMLVDGTGTLHLATVGDARGDGVERLYYATQHEGTWIPFVELFSEADERAALALTTDGTLHLIWDNDEGEERSIMVSSRQLGPAGAPLPHSLASDSMLTSYETAVSTPAKPDPSPTPQLVIRDTASSTLNSSPDTPVSSMAVIALSSLAAGFFIVVSVLIAMVRRSR